MGWSDFELATGETARLVSCEWPQPKRVQAGRSAAADWPLRVAVKLRREIIHSMPVSYDSRKSCAQYLPTFRDAGSLERYPRAVWMGALYKSRPVTGM